MACKAPIQVHQMMIQGGRGRTQQTIINTLLLAFLAGAYIAFGGFLAIRASGGMPAEVWGSLSKFVFGAVFPTGLVLVLIAGADLFTGNCMTVPNALYCGETNILGLSKSWTLSWIGNLIGSLFVAYFLAYGTGLILEPTKVGDVVKNMPWAVTVVKLANMKTGLTWSAAFWRAVGCNWMVCLAIFVAAASEDVVGKIVALWFPIMAFATIGFEHSVANMFFIPLGLLTGNDPSYLAFAKSAEGIAVHAPMLKATWNAFFIKNLIPVTLGNIVGAAIFVSGIYTLTYGQKPAQDMQNCKGVSAK